MSRYRSTEHGSYSWTNRRSRPFRNRTTRYVRKLRQGDSLVGSPGDELDVARKSFAGLNPASPARQLGVCPCEDPLGPASPPRPSLVVRVLQIMLPQQILAVVVSVGS